MRTQLPARGRCAAPALYAPIPPPPHPPPVAHRPPFPAAPHLARLLDHLLHLQQVTDAVVLLGVLGADGGGGMAGRGECVSVGVEEGEVESGGMAARQWHGTMCALHRLQRHAPCDGHVTTHTCAARCACAPGPSRQRVQRGRPDTGGQGHATSNAAPCCTGGPAAGSPPPTLRTKNRMSFSSICSGGT